MTMKNYGKNQASGASSDTPNNPRTSSELADNLRASGTDGILDKIISEGRKGDTGNVQKRPHSDAQYPTTHGHKNPDGSPSGRVIAGLAASEREPVRKPGG
jgi:hypothetical protein